MGNFYCCDEKEFESKKRSSKKVINRKKTSIDLNSSSDEGQNHQDLVETDAQIKRQGAQKYQSIKLIGRGVFGSVVVAQDKQNHKKYAMKVIEKSKIKQYNVLQCEKMKKISENDIFVSIRETFQNQQHIYLVMEYLERGDLFFYLKQRENVFSEEIIKNIAAEIIEGIQILHAEDIVYRQLKPENILITDDGHIKLADYGLSKIIVGDKSRVATFAGSVDYTAPQAFRGNYGKQIDVWALGILLYELKFKKHPIFEAQKEQILGVEAIRNKIESFRIDQKLKENIGQISNNFRDLLTHLLDNDPEKRITISDIKKHQFFSLINWEDVPGRKNPPPIKLFIGQDHIKFRDPNNKLQTAHRKFIEHKGDFQTNLYEFSTTD